MGAERGLLGFEKGALDDFENQGPDAKFGVFSSIQNLFNFLAVRKTHRCASAIHDQLFHEISCDGSIVL